jgi:glycerophosphoryl diester phosphodiesterase
MSQKPLFAIGHRGASAYAPENTVAAFDEAIRLGAQAVEFDVRLSADGEMVVVHDATVDRTTNGTGHVNQIEKQDLMSLDAGSWMDQRFTGERIPMLWEALLAIGPHAMPVLELKEPIPAEPLIKLLRKYDLETDALILSFDEAWLHPIRRYSKDVSLGLLVDSWRHDVPERAKNLAAEVVCVNIDCLGTNEVAAIQSKGLEVWCYTANDVGMVAACAAMGVTGIITDRPDLIRTR